MITGNGLVILTESEDQERIKRIVNEAITAYKNDPDKDKPKYININELRVLLGAKNENGTIKGFPSATVIYEWIKRPVKPLPSYGTKPKMFIESEALEWFQNDRDTYQR